MDQSINPSFKPIPKKNPEADELFASLRKGDKTALALAITLAESNETSQQKIGREILKMAFPFSGKSKRLGITGVPGAGKSTFIESFGKYIIDQGGKVAVLAIDPSSSINKGSILGDKTRMEELSVNPNAFVRPTASGNELGGVARNTFESIILCEAAGYDHIFVETVGVGQSETEVKNLTDLFILIAISGAGDELQGIKRGIMEMADLVLVNKADGTNKSKALETVKEIKNALSILGNSSDWRPQVHAISSLEKDQNENILNIVNQFYNHIYLNNKFNIVRSDQQLSFFHRNLRNQVLQHFISKYNLDQELIGIEKRIKNGEISGFDALDTLISKIQFK